MNLLEQLESDLKEASRMRDELRLSVLRMLKAALKNQEIEVGHDLSMPEVLAVLQKEAKKRQDSAKAYTEANRPELAAQEESEAKMIESYLPDQLSDEQLDKIISEVLSETGISTKAEMGKAMSQVMPKVAGRADGKRVSERLASKLS